MIRSPALRANRIQDYVYDIWTSIPEMNPPLLLPPWLAPRLCRPKVLPAKTLQDADDPCPGLCPCASVPAHGPLCAGSPSVFRADNARDRKTAPGAGSGQARFARASGALQRGFKHTQKSCLHRTFTILTMRHLLPHRLRILEGYDPPCAETKNTSAFQLPSSTSREQALQKRKERS